MTARRLALSVAMALAAALLHLTAWAQGEEQDRDRGRDEGGRVQSLVHDGIERRYVVYAPIEASPGNARVPLVIVLHGGGGNAENAAEMTGFSEKAAEEGFIVAYPEGTGILRRRLLTWNAGHCCAYAMDKDVDDVAFIAALIDKLSARYPVDPRRIYATGMSNGGMLAHRLAIEMPDRIAAIAPVVATLFGDEAQPEAPVPAIIVNGMIDETIPLRGGPPGGSFPRAWDGTPMQPAIAQAEFWADANGCADMPEERDLGLVVVRQYPCPPDAAVELYLIEDNGHAWPGGRPGSRRADAPSMSLSATDVIWDFFSRHAN